MAMITVGATYGLGLPQDMLSFNESKMALLYGWVNQLIALVAIGLGKLTIVAFLEQVQGYQTKARSIFLWSLAGSNLVVNCVAAILMMLQCSPRRMLWEAYTKEYCPYRSRIQIFGYIQGRECISRFCGSMSNIDSLVCCLRLCARVIPNFVPCTGPRFLDSDPDWPLRTNGIWRRVLHLPSYQMSQR